MEKKFIQFFKMRVLAKKTNLREAGGQKNKKLLKNKGTGETKKASAKGTEKKGSWMVSLYRPCQDPIGTRSEFLKNISNSHMKIVSDDQRADGCCLPIENETL